MRLREIKLEAKYDTYLGVLTKDGTLTNAIVVSRNRTMPHVMKKNMYMSDNLNESLIGKRIFVIVPNASIETVVL